MGVAITLALTGCLGNPEGNGPNGPFQDLHEDDEPIPQADSADAGLNRELQDVQRPFLADPTRAAEDGLIWVPILLEEQRRIRDEFRWDQTKQLSETSSRSQEVDGEVIALPPMHYALIYVEHRDHLRELEEMGIHYDLAPLFDSEWPDTEEQSLTLPFEGDLEDGGSQFVFALVPSPVYNLIRLEAMAGEETFRAIVLREVPDEARAQDGTVSWDYLLANLTDYAPLSTENTDEGEIVPELLDEGEVIDEADTEDSEKRLGRRLRKFARRVARGVKRITNGVRRVIGFVARAFLRDTKITIKTHVNPRTPVPMTRAWDDGEGGYGKPLMLTGLQVNMSGQSRLTLYRGTLNSEGEATISVPRTLRVNICFEADTPTARMEMGLFRAVRHCWPKHRPKGESDTIERAIGETEFYSLALMIDAREYANKVLGFKPPKALVQVGRLASWLSTEERAFVPCLAATRAPVWMGNLYSDALTVGASLVSAPLSGGLVPFVPLGEVVEFATTTDIVMPKGSQRSRNISVHEYGHFFFCTLLRDTSMHSFSKVWSQVFRLKNLTGERDSPAVAINEGFADWFSSQASGSVDYFALKDTSGRREGDNDGPFFILPSAPSLGEGLEENVGGPECGADQGLNLPGCSASGPWLKESGSRVVATVVTILHDAVDRASCGSDPRCLNEKRTDAAAWYPPQNTNDPFTPEDPFAIGDVGDETIALSPSAITDAIQAFARDGRHSGGKLTYKAFFGALAGVMKDDIYSDAEICNLFALHRPDGKCPQRWTNTGTIPRVTVSYSANPAEGGDVQGAGIGDTSCTASSCLFDAGQSVTLVAKPRANYAFSGWTGCSNAIADSLQLKNVLGAKTCVANFRPNTVALSFNASGGGHISTSITGCTSSPCQSSYGATVTLNATPDTDWVFHTWSGCSHSNSASITLYELSRDTSCTATFVRQTFVVNANATAGGSVTPSNVAVSGGGSVTLQATADSGYRFSHYSGSPQCTGTDPRLVLSPVRSAITCTANFVRTYQVSFAAADAEASVSAEPGSGASCFGASCNVDAGGGVVLRMVASHGPLYVKGWDCTDADTGAVVTSRGTANPSVLTLGSIANPWRCVATTNPYLF